MSKDEWSKLKRAYCLLTISWIRFTLLKGSEHMFILYCFLILLCTSEARIFDFLIFFQQTKYRHIWFCHHFLLRIKQKTNRVASILNSITSNQALVSNISLDNYDVSYVKMCMGPNNISGPGKRCARCFVNFNVKLLFDSSFCREIYALQAYTLK